MTATAKTVESTLAICLATAYFAYVFQFSGGVIPTAGLGDWIDPYFINYLLEHWYQSIRHFTAPSSPPMYFPARGTLGYSHGLVLYAPIYGALRPWLDPFRAETVMAFIVMAGGTAALFAVLRFFIRATLVESLALTALFATSPNVVNGETAVWLQRASVFLIPPIVWLMLVSLAMRDGWRRWLIGGFAGFAGLLVFTQDFYTGAFALLVGALQFAGALPWLGRRVAGAWIAPLKPTGPSGRDARTGSAPSVAWLVISAVAALWAAAIWLHPIARVELGSIRFSAENYRRPFLIALVASAWFAERRWQLIRRVAAVAIRIKPTPYARATTLGALAGAAVFAWIYLPVYLEGRTFPPEHILNASHAVNPSDWHGLMNAIWSIVPFATARSFVLVFFVGLAAAIPRIGIPSTARRHAAWSMVVAAIVIALPLKFGDLSVWRAALGWAPGFSSIRDPRRVIYLYELAVALAAALFLVRLRARSPIRLVTTVAVVMLVAFGWNRHVFPYERPLSDFAEWVKKPIAVDPTCRSFYIKGASREYMARSGHMWSLYNVDAMFIALDRDLPTLNGYSAWGPVGWELANPQEDVYSERVRSWIGHHQLTGVCEFDVDARTMTPTTLVR